MENHAPAPIESGPDWEIGKLYSQAWEVVKKNKVLWIFGMAVSGFSVGNISNFNSRGSSSNDFNYTFPQASPDSLNNVLGASTSDVMNQIVGAIPPGFYVLLVLEILIIAGVFITIGLISRSWAYAALIHAIKTSLGNAQPTIRDASEAAFANIKSLIWLQIVPTLILVIVGIVMIGITAIWMATADSFMRGILVLVLLVEIAGLVYGGLRLIMSLIWAERDVILNGASAKPALMHGYRISKRKFWSMLLLGFVNMVMSMIILGLPMLVIVGIILGGVWSLEDNAVLGIILAGFGAILFLAFMIAAILVSGIITAFKATVWTIAYNNIKGKYD